MKEVKVLLIGMFFKQLLIVNNSSHFVHPSKLCVIKWFDWFLVSVNLIVVVSTAKLQADADYLHSAYPPSKFLDELAINEKPNSNQNNTSQTSDQPNEVSAESFKLLQGPRHNEFDWSVIKVSDTLINISFGKISISFS